MGSFVILNDFLNSFATIILNDIKKNKKSTTKQVYVCKENYIGVFCLNKLIMMLVFSSSINGSKGFDCLLAPINRFVQDIFLLS